MRINAWYFLIVIWSFLPIQVLADDSKHSSVTKPVKKIESNHDAAKNKKTEAVKPKGETKPLSDFELGKYQYCGDDRDCVVAQNGCCDCANGGADVAVNKDRLSAFNTRFDCLYVSCGEEEITPPCGSGVVSCINHKCRYISEPAADQRF